MSRAHGLVALALLAILTGQATAGEDAVILLVCEHGSVKSLIAAALFNKKADERKLPFHAIARGVSPDAQVPPKIAEALVREGFSVAGFRPAAVSNDDVARAIHVVAIGVEAASLPRDRRVPVEQWDDVPAASVDYAASHNSLERHVSALLDRLARERQTPR